MFILVHSVLSYLKVSAPLFTRMAQIEAEISVFQASIPVKLEQIAELRRSLRPLEDDFKQLRDYHARLTYIERRAAEEEKEKEKEEEEEKGKDIKRARLGLDRYI